MQKKSESNRITGTVGRIKNRGGVYTKDLATLTTTEHVWVLFSGGSQGPTNVEEGRKVGEG